MTDNLRIPVTVTDGFSAPLAKFRNQMQQVGNASGIKALNADWKRIEGSVINVGREVASLSPMFSGLGMASMGLGAGIAAAAISVRNFALGASDMSMFGRETGVAVEKLRVLEAVGRRYGVTADQVRGSVRGAADNFDQIRRRIGGLYQELRSRGEFNLAENLVGSKNVNEYMDKIFDAATRMNNPKRRQEFLRQALGSEDFSKIIGDLGPKWRELFAEVQGRIGNMPAGAEAAAQKFGDAMDRMNEAMEKLRNHAMAPLLETSADLISTWEKPFGGALLTFMKDMKSGLDNLNAAGKAWKDGDYFGAIKALDGGQPIFKDLSATLPESETKAVAARMERLAAASKQLEKLASALDSGRISGGARDNAISARDRLQDEVKRLTDELVKLREQGATIQQQSLGGGGFGGGSLIQNAAFGGAAGSPGGVVGGMGAWANFRRQQRQIIDEANSAGLVGSGVSGDAPSRAAGATTPQGDGRGTRGSASVGFMMRHAMDQLRREGVPEAQLRTAAAHLVGQAKMESGLNPNAVHDQGTGFGIYGARDPTPGRGRRTNMFRWLAANGYARNSAEGQMRYMAYEAMNGGFKRTRQVLMGRGTGNLEADTNTITREFEAPKYINRRSGAVATALRVGPDVAASDGGDALTGSYAKERNKNFANLRERRYSPGDEMMQTAAKAAGGLHNPAKVEGSARLTIDINGLPTPNYRARTTVDGMFKDVKLHAGKGQMLQEGVTDI